MAFLNLIKHSYYLSKFSPNGQFLASAQNNRALVRNARTLQILKIFTCVDNINVIEWSYDSEFLICGVYKRRIIQVWSPTLPDWKCKITQGMFNIIDVCFSPDSRHILVTSEFHLRISVWSLCDKAIYYIKYAKPISHDKQFSRNGKFLALAERRDSQDHISIFTCATWQLIKNFKPKTSDMAGIMWAPDDSVLCIWESPLVEYSFYIYSLVGECLQICKGDLSALAINAISWAPTSQLLAVGSFDQKVRLFNHITWKSFVYYDHPPCIKDKNVSIYRETIAHEGLFENSLQQCEYTIQDVRPYFLPTINTSDTNHFQYGIKKIEFSNDCQYIATINEYMPSVLWIWSVKNIRMSAILIQKEPISCFEWHPEQSCIAICTGSTRVYLWTQSECKSIVPGDKGDLHIQKLKWNPVGSSLLAYNQEEAYICNI